jgi:hypothetical protein
MPFFSDLDQISPQNDSELTPSGGFFSDLEEDSSLTFPKLGMGKKVKGPSKVPEMKRLAGRSGKVIGSTIAGLPGDIVGSSGTGLNWLAKHVPGGSPKSEEELKEITENPFTSQKFIEGIENIFPSTKPKTAKEREWEDNLGLLTSLVTPIPLGKAKAVDPRKAKAIYQAGKRLGMAEKDLTPLLHGKISKDVLATLAKKSEEAARNLKLSEDAVSGIYDSLKTRGASLEQIPSKVEEKLRVNLSKMSNSLQKTLAPSAEKQSAISFIEKAEDQLMNFGATPEELINFYQDINKTINWKAVHGGKKYLAEMKSFVKDALKESSPTLAKDFEDTNRLYSHVKSIQKTLGANKIYDFINYGAGTAFLGSLLTGNFGLSSKLALGAAGKKALSKIATKLLTDPKWQNIHGKIFTSVKNGKYKASAAILQSLKEKVRKDLPEEYEQIEWPE